MSHRALPTVPTISADELRAELERGGSPVILDLRSPAAWAEWTIPGSVNVHAHDPLWARDPDALADFRAEPGTRVVAVCGAGRTSRLAAEQLRSRGVEALSLDGGMRAWSLAWNSADVPLTPSTGVEIVQVRRTGKGCLSYIVGSGDQAAVVDPSVEPGVYVDLARARGWTIVAVFDTHVHADHLSRGRRLAAATGATLYLPAQDRVRYPFHALKDGDAVTVGGSTITTLHTPGHTFESACYLVDGRAIMTGDTLFLTTVGRPDLKAGTEAETRERAGLLFQSLQRLSALDAATVVLPGHTAAPVPFDGRALGATLGEVRQQAALLDLGQSAFVDAILARIPATPPNHMQIVSLNEAGESPDDPAHLEAGANRCAIA